MARSFTAATDRGTFTTGLAAAQTRISVSYWAWMNDVSVQRIHFQWGDFSTVSGFIIETVAGPLAVIGQVIGGGGFWSDQFTCPSTGTWHHWLVVFDTNTPVNKVWIDGVAQTLTTRNHSGGPTTVTNATDAIGNNPAAGAVMNGRIAEFTIYNALLGQTAATALSQRCASRHIEPSTTQNFIIFYAPLLGDSPEVDYSAGRHSVTLTGSSVVQHPGVQSVNVVT